MRLSAEQKILLADLAIAIGFLAIVGLIVWALVEILPAAEESRTYHPVSVTEMAGDNPSKWAHVRTHVEVTGFVRYMKREADGDLHIRLCDSNDVKTMDRKRCVVAEAIPGIPIKAPKVGQKVTVHGIARYDAEVPNHSWWECHPVESLMGAP